MVAGFRPDLAVQAAWNADPNDPAAVPTWSDLTSLFLGASSVKRGKQYELDQVQTSQPTLDFLDPSESLNPANASSPYAPNLLPLRQILLQGVWPNTTVGNLLAGQLSPVVDPSFESYSNGASLSWVLAIGSGVAPTVTTTNPHGGTKCLTYAATSGTGTNGVGVTITCMPGRQYTASLWLRQTGANTNLIFINGGAAGSSTSTTGAYVRLSVTFTATQPIHQLWVTSSATSVTGTVWVDEIQLEQGNGLTAFTMSGPVIYPVLRDYIENLPAEWDQESAGYLGLCSLTAVDAFAALNAVDLWAEYRNSVLAKKPDYYWPLADASGATTFAEASGNNGPNLILLSNGTPNTFQAGISTAIPGDPSGAGVQFSGTGDSGLYVGTGSTPRIAIGSNTATWGATMSCWLNTTDTSAIGFFGTVADNANQFPQFDLSEDVGGKLFINVAGPGSNPGFINTPDTAAAYTDGKWHHIVCTIELAANSMTVTLWIDGANVSTATANVTTTFGTATPDFRMQRACISSGSLVGLFHGLGTFTHYALWNRTLTNAEIADLWSAGKGYTGETSGARINRYLGYGWNGTSAVDTGQSTMGVSTLTGRTSLLAACQSVATSENGNFFVDGRGTVTFKSRTSRYLATTPTYVFGENTAGGELPYEGDIKFEFDNVQIFNDIEVTRPGGIVAVAVDATSKKRYFPRSYQRTVNVASDLEATDAANSLLASHKDPVQRVDQITLNPVTYPALWPVVLGIELGTRVTVKKRSKAANGGAGLTQSGDFFVESIEHTDIDMEAGTWKTILLLSPAAAQLQPWILGDPTYGLLDTTTRLGY